MHFGQSRLLNHIVLRKTDKSFQKTGGFGKILLLQVGYKVKSTVDKRKWLETAALDLMKPDTAGEKYHAPGPASRAAKKFPRFRRAWETFLLSAPLHP